MEQGNGILFHWSAHTTQCLGRALAELAMTTEVEAVRERKEKQFDL